MSLKDKTVMITGANGGIGRKLVESFAQEGCQIYAHMRSEKEEFLVFAKEMQEKYKINVNCIYFDVSNEADIKQGLQQLIKEKISIDILVNNAGIAHGGLVQMTPMAVVKEVFDINYFSVVQITQTISRLMARNGGGAIINIASISGLELDAGNCAYGASKAAVIALTKSISKELAGQNIRVNAVAPGLTDTNMATLMEEKAGDAMVRNTAFNRLAKPEEIADAVVFLASEKSSFITGQVIRVDGGM